MLRLKSLFLRIYAFQFESFGFVSWKTVRKIDRQPSLVVKTTTMISSLSPTPTPTPTPIPWDSLPSDILASIFQKLWVGDRVRSRLVCKLWDQILTEDYIPKTPEAPWKILSDDSYKKPHARLDEIRFKSLSEQRIYRFQLPLSICDDSQSQSGWWCCGSSRGWLLVAVGANLNASMFLWQPLSGETRKLPPGSTLPYFDEYIAIGAMGKIDNLSSLIRRVEVFSIGLTECIVAVLFRRNTCNEIALCTPHDKTWKVFGDGNFGVGYSDMLFHTTNKQLYALATEMPLEEHQWENFLSKNKEVVLSESCCVPMNIILLPLEATSIRQGQFGLGLQLAQNHKPIWHFVESSVTHKILFVSAWLDCVVRENAWKEPVVRFRSQQTTQLIVSTMDTENYNILSGEKYKFEILKSIGEETIFLGDASLAIPAVGDGICADCIYFATNDAQCLESHSNTTKIYTVREHGVFSLREKEMKRMSFNTVRLLSGSRVGWFMPQL